MLGIEGDIKTVLKKLNAKLPQQEHKEWLEQGGRVQGEISVEIPP